MKINKFFKSAVAASAALMLTGCASDYLDTPQPGVVDEADIASTTDVARMTMLGVCGRGLAAPWSIDLFLAQALMMGETGVGTYYGEIPGSDNYVNFIYDQAPTWVILYSMQPNCLSAGGYVWNYAVWNYCYACLAQLNDLLAVIDNAEGPEEERNFTKAQTLTLRAHLFLRLLQVYAPRWEDSKEGTAETIILRDVKGTPREMGVSPMNDVLARIYKDLDDAIGLFQQSGSTQREFTYEPTLAVAYGVYARAAALKHDWQTCRTMAHNARQGYRIATDAEILSGYMSFNENEWMWSPSFLDIDNYIYGNWCTFFACNAYAANNARYTNRINKDLYNQIPEGDTRRDWWLTSDKMTGTVPAMFYSSVGVNPATQQFNLDAMLNSARTWLKNRKPANCTGLNAYAGTGVGDKATAILCDGAQVKFWCNGETGQDGVCFPPFMRATEMYLYEAEACAELGMTTEAQTLLNQINQPHNTSYNCTATGDDLIEEVRLYRRIELWGEGFNWFDLKRWNVPMVRRAWVEGDITSNNIPAGLACEVPVTQNFGWRYGIPNSERNKNTLITSPIPGEVVDETLVEDEEEE